MRTADDLWLLTVLLWLGLSWLSAYLASGLTSGEPPRQPAAPEPQAAHTPVRRRLSPLPNDSRPIHPTTPSRSSTAALEPSQKPRGRRKFIPTEGYACLNPDCRYRLITDARIHALVGDGVHGHDRIPDSVSSLRPQILRPP